jgi:hypothetical protein
MALPTFFVIGAAKAGTTSLHHYLAHHPQIHMSAVKEPNFFAGPENGIPYPVGRIDSLPEYERLFDSPLDVRGETSPAYTNHPRRQGVPERISELVPDAKCVYLVRDPIERTVSHYQHSVAVAGERRTLREALDDLTDPYLAWTCNSMYASQLEHYLKRFPQERILVVDQADLLTDRRSTLREIFAFLLVEETFTCPQFNQQLYRSRDRRVYPPGYERFVGGVLAPSVRWIPPRVRHRARRAVERVLWSALETPTLDPGLSAQLQELYSDEVLRLRALTGKAFATWSV